MKNINSFSVFNSTCKHNLIDSVRFTQVSINQIKRLIKPFPLTNNRHWCGDNLIMRKTNAPTIWIPRNEDKDKDDVTYFAYFPRNEDYVAYFSLSQRCDWVRNMMLDSFSALWHTPSVWLVSVKILQSQPHPTLERTAHFLDNPSTRIRAKTRPKQELDLTKSAPSNIRACCKTFLTNIAWMVFHHEIYF